MAEFEMTDLGKLFYFLGMEFLNTPKKHCSSQMRYASEVLKRLI